MKCTWPPDDSYPLQGCHHNPLSGELSGEVYWRIDRALRMCEAADMHTHSAIKHTRSFNNADLLRTHHDCNVEYQQVQKDQHNAQWHDAQHACSSSTALALRAPAGGGVGLQIRAACPLDKLAQLAVLQAEA
eukprot:1160044-Pelagomonas_calceolata.AAC.8